MTNHIVLPVLIPLVTGIITLLLNNRRAERAVSLVGVSLGLIYAIYLLALVWQQGRVFTAMGNWPPPYGIVLVVDMFSAIMLLLSALMGWVVLLYTFATLDQARERHNFYTLYLLMLMGVNGAFLAGDLFNLYVWFEVMLIASFGLMTLGGERGQIEGGLKYVVINLISSTVFLIAIGLLYGLTGTLNLADLHRVLSAYPPTAITNALAMLFLVTFGVKAAIFPLFFWLPASYHTPPVAVTALFGGLLTKVGVYAMFRVFPLLFGQENSFIFPLLLIIAGLTMTVGVLGAIAQDNVRRILSFHIISQIGYMIMGLGLYTVAGLAGGIFYIIHHIIVKTALLMIGGGIEHLNGTGQLKQLGGQMRQRPWFALLFLLAALSLAGIPPLSGFFSKLSLLFAAASSFNYGIAAVSLVVSLLTLFSMSKIWSEVFWKPAPEPAAGHTEIDARAADQISAWRIAFPAALLVALTILIGLAAGPMLTLATVAAEQLMAPQEYTTFLLGTP
ncbi:MAG: proton-conducting transporter membrane subunit [Anaerolineae bacterium]|jgi:multicomponent Na+:H+ antiporter subunit D